jgi:glutathione S-transferase
LDIYKKVPRHLKLYEARLASTKSGYFVDSGLTYVDLRLFGLLEWLGENKDLVLAEYPYMKQLDQNVRSHGKIASWLAKRPITPY